MTDWREFAACQGYEDLFFRPEGETGTNAYKRDTAAKLVCLRCPVRQVCLDTYIGEVHGVWGGTSPRERAGLRRQQRWAELDRARLEAAS